MIVNLQRKIRLDLAELRIFASRISEVVSEIEGREFSAAFVSDRRITELNRLYRNKASTTDVLSFSYEADEFDPENNNLGDIVISAEQAQKQALENELDLETEIKQLILHGALHLCGYDHETDEGEMNARELELREKLGI